MTKYIFEGIMPKDSEDDNGSIDLSIEDDGCAKIATITGVNEQMFVRVQSWVEDSSIEEHTSFDKLLGKKVIVTVEVVD